MPEKVLKKGETYKDVQLAATKSKEVWHDVKNQKEKEKEKKKELWHVDAWTICQSFN